MLKIGYCTSSYTSTLLIYISSIPLLRQHLIDFRTNTGGLILLSIPLAMGNASELAHVKQLGKIRRQTPVFGETKWNHHFLSKLTDKFSYQSKKVTEEENQLDNEAEVREQLETRAASRMNRINDFPVVQNLLDTTSDLRCREESGKRAMIMLKEGGGGDNQGCYK